MYMKTTKLLIKTNHSKYSIFIGSKLISNLSEIIEKQSKNKSFCMIFIFLTKSLPNRTHMAMGCAGTLKMEVRGVSNSTPRRQNDPRDLQDKAQEHQNAAS